MKNLMPCQATIAYILLVPPSDYQQLDCLDSLCLVVAVGFFSKILDPVTEKDICIFKGTFMDVIRADDFRMTPRAHAFAYHVSEYVRRSAVPLGGSFNVSMHSTTDSKIHV